MDEKQAQAALEAAPSNPITDFLKEFLTARMFASAVLLPLAVVLVPPLAPLIAADPATAATLGGLLIAGVDVAESQLKKRRTKRASKPAPKKPAQPGPSA